MAEFGMAPPEVEPARVCKDCGGEFDDMPRRGMYANRCAECRKKLAAEKHSGQSARAAHERRRETEQGETFEQKARTLVSYGRRLDQAVATVRDTGLKHQDAKSIALRAVEEWKGACLRLAGTSPGGRAS